MSVPAIGAVIPVWNGRDLLAKLLDSLERQTRRASELIVVDNGSTDGAPELARRRGARVISMGRNAGFAAAVNRGILESRAEWIAVLNTDVELAPEYFENLLAAAESTGARFATGKLLAGGSQDSIDGTWDAISRACMPWRVGQGSKTGAWCNAVRRIPMAPWTAALFRADLFRSVGLLEESFESYLEDVDFGLRCAASALEGVYVPGAVAWHKGSATLGRWHPATVRRMARNQVWLLARHYPRKAILRWLWPVLVGQLLWGGVALRHGCGLAWMRGKWDGVAGFRSARQKCGRMDYDVLCQLTRAGESVMHEIQRVTHRDMYWRLYFLLTGGEAN